jgi:diguanylate cyclase (GGDEF)-like protein
VRKEYRQGVLFLALVALYVAGDWYAVHVAKGPGDTALLLPSAGLALAIVAQLGYRWVCVVPVAMLLSAVLWPHAPALAFALSIIGNTLGALAGGWVGRRGALPTHSDSRYGFQMLLGGLVLSIVSAGIASIGPHWLSLTTLTEAANSLLLAFMANFLGVVAFAPALLLFTHRGNRDPAFTREVQRKRERELLLWDIALPTSFLLMAWGASAGGRYSLGLSSLPLAVMVWSALRFEPLYTAVAEALLLGLIGSFNWLGLSGFEPTARILDSMMLSAFLCVLAILPVTLALVVNESRLVTLKLIRRANTDQLTRLPNRRAFETAMRTLLAHPATPPLALAYLDLDNLKLVNDTASHTAGDALIGGIARLLQSGLQEGDSLAHLGADEFAVLFHNCTSTVARERAQLLVRAVESYRCIWNGRTLSATASVGVVPFQSGEADFSQLLSQSDAACFTAKELGGNRVCMAGASRGDVLDRTVAMRWAVRIRDALEQRSFTLYAQTMAPLHERIAPGRHFELLLRMQDVATGELLLPGQFMPPAERFRLGVQIDRAVVGMALDWLESHPEQAASVATCSINLSGDALVDEAFIGFVAERLRRSSFQGSQLCFEITETSAVRDVGRAQRFINQMRALGCRFALDDFGTGFCSFSYLRSLDVDYFKIDGSFVREMENSPLAAAVVRSITQIAHVLHKHTIAEHTENNRLRATLTELGVDYAQGYAIDRPQPLASYFT